MTQNDIDSAALFLVVSLTLLFGFGLGWMLCDHYLGGVLCP